MGGEQLDGGDPFNCASPLGGDPTGYNDQYPLDAVSPSMHELSGIPYHQDDNSLAVPMDDSFSSFPNELGESRNFQTLQPSSSMYEVEMVGQPPMGMEGAGQVVYANGGPPDGIMYEQPTQVLSNGDHSMLGGDDPFGMPSTSYASYHPSPMAEMHSVSPSMALHQSRPNSRAAIPKAGAASGLQQHHLSTPSTSSYANSPAPLPVKTLAVSAPPPKKKQSNGRKKPTPPNTVGAVLTKANKMASAPSSAAGSLSLSLEETKLVAKLSSEIERLQNDRLRDNRAEITRLEKERAQIFIQALASQQHVVARNLAPAPAAAARPRVSHVKKQPQQQQHPSSSSPGYTPQCGGTFQTTGADGYGGPGPSHAGFAVNSTQPSPIQRTSMFKVTTSAASSGMTGGPPPGQVFVQHHTVAQQQPAAAGGPIGGQPPPQMMMSSLQQQQQHMQHMQQQHAVGPPLQQPPMPLPRKAGGGGRAKGLQHSVAAAASISAALQQHPPNTTVRAALKQGALQQLQQQHQLMQQQQQQQQLQQQQQQQQQQLMQTQQAQQQQPMQNMHHQMPSTSSAQQQQQQQQPQQSQPQPLLQLSLPVQQPPQIQHQQHMRMEESFRPNPAQVMRRMDEKRQGRMRKLQNAFDIMSQQLLQPDSELPFTGVDDIFKRLMPYHLLYEHNLDPQIEEEFDLQFSRAMVEADEKRMRLTERMRKIAISEAQAKKDEERNLLLFLDAEFERGKLEDDRRLAREDQDTMLATARTTALALAVAPLAAPSERLKELRENSSLSVSSAMVASLYEYHPFVERRREPTPPPTPPPPGPLHGLDESEVDDSTEDEAEVPAAAAAPQPAAAAAVAAASPVIVASQLQQLQQRAASVVEDEDEVDDASPEMGVVDEPQSRLPAAMPVPTPVPTPAPAPTPVASDRIQLASPTRNARSVLQVKSPVRTPRGGALPPSMKAAPPPLAVRNRMMEERMREEERRKKVEEREKNFAEDRRRKEDERKERERRGREEEIRRVEEERRKKEEEEEERKTKEKEEKRKREEEEERVRRKEEERKKEEDNKRRKEEEERRNREKEKEIPSLKIKFKLTAREEIKKEEDEVRKNEENEREKKSKKKRKREKREDEDADERERKRRKKERKERERQAADDAAAATAAASAATPAAAPSIGRAAPVIPKLKIKLGGGAAKPVAATPAPPATAAASAPRAAHLVVAPPEPTLPMPAAAAEIDMQLPVPRLKIKLAPPAASTPPVKDKEESRRRKEERKRRKEKERRDAEEKEEEGNKRAKEEKKKEKHHHKRKEKNHHHHQDKEQELTAAITAAPQKTPTIPSLKISMAPPLRPAHQPQPLPSKPEATTPGVASTARAVPVTAAAATTAPVPAAPPAAAVAALPMLKPQPRQLFPASVSTPAAIVPPAPIAMETVQQLLLQHMQQKIGMSMQQQQLQQLHSAFRPSVIAAQPQLPQPHLHHQQQPAPLLPFAAAAAAAASLGLPQPSQLQQAAMTPLILGLAGIPPGQEEKSPERVVFSDSEDEDDERSKTLENSAAALNQMVGHAPTLLPNHHQQRVPQMQPSTQFPWNNQFP